MDKNKIVIKRKKALPSSRQTLRPLPRPYKVHAIEGGGGGGALIPLRLVATGGQAGGASSQCSWSYSVYDIMKDISNPIALSQNVGELPHMYQRPLLGAMVAATFGLGYYADANTVTLMTQLGASIDEGDIVVCYANEVFEVEVCEPEEEP